MTSHNLKILIIDDDTEVLMQTARILKSGGYDVWQTDSIIEGWELLKQKPDILLLDVVMPGKNGFEICREIKAVPEFSDIFVILVSGVKISVEDQTAGLNLGADGFITRPFTQAELLARLKSYVRIHDELTKIRSSEKWLETTLNSMCDGLIVTDGAGKIIFMNPSAENIVQFSQVELIGRQVDSVLKLKDGKTGEKMEHLIADLLRDKIKNMRIEQAIYDENMEQPVYVELAATLISYETGETGVVIIIRDISKSVVAEQGLEHYRADLENKVLERTKKLQDQNDKLEHYHELFVGREFRIKELRDQVQELESKLAACRMNKQS